MDPDPSSLLSTYLTVTPPALSDYFIAALLLLLIISNAIASGAEIAFFILEQKYADELNSSADPKKIRISKLLRKSEKLPVSFVVTQLFLLVTITVLIIYLLNRLSFFEGNVVNNFAPGVIILVCVIVLLTNILSKLYASRHPLRFVQKNYAYINLVYKLMSPFFSLLPKKSTILGYTAAQWQHEIAAREISRALEEDSDETSFVQEKKMLEGVIRFKDILVDDVLISRNDMFAVEMQKSFDELIQFIVDPGFSRIPVFEEDADNIKGILYVKDLLPHMGETTSFEWQTLIRPAYFVPRTKRIGDLLEEFRVHKIHIAIVVDEYGGTSGLVTMEDIIEEIIGDISDEYDNEQPFYSIAPDGSYIFEGRTKLENFIRITGLPEKDFEEMSEEVDTIAGLLLELKGDFPKRKEIFTYNNYSFQAEEMNKKRITKVRYIPSKAAADEDV